MSQILSQIWYNSFMIYEPKYTINDKVRNNLQEIERLKDVVRGHQILPEVEASIRLRATVNTVHSSTSIEGNPLTPGEVRAVIDEDKKLSKKEYAETEVQNYKRAMDFIAERKGGNSDVAKADILQLHKIITERLLPNTKSSHFRQNAVYIENQNHEVLYEAAPAVEVEPAVEGLLEWANNNRAVVPAVIIAAILHYELVTIHPFVDGNGRTSRALAMLYLALNHYDCDGTLSLDSYYASDKHAYYEILQEVHGRDYQKSVGADLTPWLEYFTNGFLTSLHVLDAEIRVLDLLMPAKSNNFGLSREDYDILNYVAEFGAIGVREAEAILPELNRRTVQRRLKKLVDTGRLSMVGATHEAKYVLKD